MILVIRLPPPLTLIRPQLRWLDLGGTAIGDYGAQALAGALDGNHTLGRLDLPRVNIRQDGALALAEALREGKQSLRHLDLTRNILGDTGVQVRLGGFGGVGRAGAA